MTEAEDHAVEAAVGHEQVRTPPDHAYRDAAPDQGGPHRIEVIGPVDLDEELGGPTHAVGGQFTEGSVARRPPPERDRQCVVAVGVVVVGVVATVDGPRFHHCGDSNRSSGSVVRSPAPRVRQRSPGRSMEPTTWRSSSQPGAYTTGSR